MDDVGTDSEGTAGLWEASFRSEMQRLRVERGLTQADLAQQLRDRGLALHQQTVARIEAGQRSIRLNEAMVIAEALGTDIARMVTPEDERQALRDMKQAETDLHRIVTYTLRFLDMRYSIGSLLNREIAPNFRADVESWLRELGPDAPLRAAGRAKDEWDEGIAAYHKAKAESDG